MTSLTVTSLRASCRKFLLILVLFFTVYVIVINTLNLRRHPIIKLAQTVPKNEQFKVPNTVHFTWFDASKPVFRFHHYLSVLSAEKRLKPDVVYFWHDKEPKGPWWDKVRKDCWITMRKRAAPTVIFNRTISVPEHRSDIVRLQVLQQYGGVYLDLDVIVLKSFQPLRNYDVTMGQEPGGLCNGIIIAKPNAEFLKLWLDSYRDFDDALWGRHSVQRPYELAKRYPSLIHIEKRTLNYPGWTELELIYGDKKYDWSGNYAVHLWYRFHNQEYNPQTIRDLKSTVGEIFRWTYYGSKELLQRH